MQVRLVSIDSKLPNLALMKLSSFHKAQGDTVVYTPSVSRELFDGQPDEESKRAAALLLLRNER